MPLVEPLAEALGQNAEVVLHDFRNLEKSVVAIAGNITNRKIGAPATNIVLSAIKSGCKQNLLNYKNILPDGRVLRSSTIMIKENEEPVGCLCINFDLTVMEALQKQIGCLLACADLANSENVKAEQFTNEVIDMTKKLIENTLNQYYKPVSLMTKDDKLAVVKQMEEQGLFLIKGVVDEVAKYLHVTKYTIYNYLDEIRSNKNFSKCE